MPQNNTSFAMGMFSKVNASHSKASFQGCFSGGIPDKTEDAQSKNHEENCPLTGIRKAISSPRFNPVPLGVCGKQDSINTVCWTIAKRLKAPGLSDDSPPTNNHQAAETGPSGQTALPADTPPTHYIPSEQVRQNLREGGREGCVCVSADLGLSLPQAGKFFKGVIGLQFQPLKSGNLHKNFQGGGKPSSGYARETNYCKGCT